MLEFFQMKKNNRAFTLIELLVVMSIMGILTVITVSQFQTARKRANDVARKGDLNAVSKALQMYFTDYGEMPEASSDGRIMIDGEEIDWGGEFKDAGGFVYMKKLPRENKTGAPEYCYKRSDDKKAYALFAMLENTTDSQCIDGISYDCGGKIDTYCFAYYSPNVSINSDGAFGEDVRIAPTSIPTSVPTSVVIPPTSTPVPTQVIIPPTTIPTRAMPTPTLSIRETVIPTRPISTDPVIILE